MREFHSSTPDMMVPHFSRSAVVNDDDNGLSFLGPLEPI
jgi:hypothetical protein